MRIGNIIIDLDSLNIEDLHMVEQEARKLRHRKEKAEELKDRMNKLLEEANNEGFDFIDKDYGYTIRADEIELWDLR